MFDKSNLLKINMDMYQFVQPVIGYVMVDKLRT